MANDNIIVHHGNGGLPVSADKVSVLASPGLVSIIVPCCGMLEYTKLLVPSLLRHTRAPFELIFLDIGSLDGTAEYLAGLEHGLVPAKVRVETVRTNTDLGIPEACKEAITQARGEYLVLLNNDTIVTPGWLLHLVKLASASPAIGMTGPMSNFAAAEQLVETVPYRMGPRKGKGRRPGAADNLVDTEAVYAFAQEFREKSLGKYIHVERLGGFCVLVKRQVLEKIGMAALEKWTDLSLFDTDILSTKARQAGFTLAVCRDLFVHHFGTRTFSAGAPEAKDRKSQAVRR
jgi:GT2 family glycosyltransferase